MSRGVMQPPDDLEPPRLPSVRAVLWMVALVLGLVVYLARVAS